MQDLPGKVALITGAASGIGLGLVDACVASGMTVVAADVDAERLAKLSVRLTETGHPHLVQVLDIRDRNAWAELLAHCERDFGPVQLLCNNAGVTATPGPMLDLQPEAWDWVVGVNLTGTFNGAQAVARRLKALQLTGHIVNTASVQGLFAAGGFAPYNAAKFGIVGLSETLRIEFAPLGIGVSVLCPGPTRTRIMANSTRLAPQFATSQVAAPATAAREGFTCYQLPDEVAAKVLAAVRSNQLYILTHGEYAPLLQARSEAIAASLGGASPEDLANIAAVEAPSIRMYREVSAATGGVAATGNAPTGTAPT